MIAVPPSRFIYETGQRGIIFFEDNIETLFLTSSFKGDADNFGWLVPTPNKPEVTKGSMELFTALNDLTKLERDATKSINLGGPSFGLLEATGGIDVLEQKKIDYYDITVLASDDKNALIDWLNKNGYRFPEAYSYVLDSYISNKWVFTAVKISQNIDPKIIAQNIWDGSLTPLKFTFQTNKPVYPLKISSIVSDPEKIDPSAPHDANTPFYFDSKFGKAAKTPAKSELHAANIGNVNIDEGTVEFWVKHWLEGGYYNGHLISIYNVAGLEKLFLGGGHKFPLTLRIAKDDVNSKVWTAGDNLNLADREVFVAVSWKKGEQPKFYIDGELLPIISSNEMRNPRYTGASSNFQNDILYLGQSKFIYSPSAASGLDEVKFSSVARTDQEILDDYNSGKAFTSDSSTKLLAHFDENLSYLWNNSKNNYFYFNTNTITPPVPVIQNHQVYKPAQVGIELYIFTKDKEQSLPGFETTYANWVTREKIEKLAFDAKGESVVKVNNKKYYLTKLTRQMSYSDMSDDLFFRDADQNSVGSSAGNSKTIFYILIVISLIITIAIAIIIIKLFNRDKTG